MAGKDVKHLTFHGFVKESEVGRHPVPPDMPGVAGIFVGGCVRQGIVGRLSTRNECAHAHTGSRNSHHGWICFQTYELFTDPAIRMHELAHIMSDQGHTDKWRAAMRQLGQPIPERYQPRKRR